MGTIVINEMLRLYPDLRVTNSLLEYRDNYLTSPRTDLERALGRWDNCLRTYYAIPDSIRRRVFMKAFADDDHEGGKPQKHGEFNDTDVPFWTEAFWLPESRDA